MVDSVVDSEEGSVPSSVSASVPSLAAGALVAQPIKRVRQSKRENRESSFFILLPSLLFGEAVLQTNHAVEGVFVLGILAEVAYANELVTLACLCGFQTGFHHCGFNLGERIGIEKIQVGFSFGNLGGVFDVEQTVVEHQRCGTRVFCGEPVNGALDLSAVGGHSVAGFKVCRGMDALDATVLVLLDSCVFDDIAVHETNLAVGLETEELGRRNLCKVVGVDIDLTRHGNLTCAELGLLRVIGDREHFLFVLGVVVDDHLDGIDDGDTAEGILVEIIAHAGFQLTNVHGVVGVGTKGYICSFDSFWKIYPKKKAKEAAKKAWVKIKPSDELVKTIIADVEAKSRSQDWKKEKGKYIPYPATYLNGKRWEDEGGTFKYDDTHDSGEDLGDLMYGR